MAENDDQTEPTTDIALERLREMLALPRQPVGGGWGGSYAFDPSTVRGLIARLDAQVARMAALHADVAALEEDLEMYEGGGRHRDRNDHV